MVVPPPHRALHLAHRPAVKNGSSHGCRLGQGRCSAGFAEDEAQRESSTTASVPSLAHHTALAWVPVPHTAEQDPQPEVTHEYVEHGPLVQFWDVAGLSPAHCREIHTHVHTHTP